MRKEKVKVTFSHENGEELYCDITINDKGMKMDVKRKGEADMMKADKTLIYLLAAFAKGLKEEQ